MMKQSSALTNTSRNGLVCLNISGVEASIYVFSDFPNGLFETLSDSESSQRINLGAILDAGFFPEEVKLRVNFDCLSLNFVFGRGDPRQYQRCCDGSGIRLRTASPFLLERS